ncbi:MAG: VOC family protein [Streptomyces albidoflavus]
MTAWLHLFLDVPEDAFEKAATFWSAATGWQPSPRRGERDQFLTLLPGEGAPWVKLQAVPGPGGVHLDLDSTDCPSAVARGNSLGAIHAWVYEGVEVARSPGGLLFCHTLAEPGGAPRLARGGEVLLDQVCLDIPSQHWDTETAFWRDLTERPLRPGSSPGYAYLEQDGQPRILLQRLGEATGPVRAHPDLATADRPGQTRRHTALGAELVSVHYRWSVLRAPDGQVYCLTDRSPTTGQLSD